MRLAIILGTRPEIIKCAPVIRVCQEQKINFKLIHTGQHYSQDMDAIFFEELDLPPASYNLQVGSGTHGAQTGLMLAKIEEVLIKEQPDAVLVQGDTNSALSGALSAVKLNIPVGHIEAGIRSYFRRMPEEINRVLVDSIANYLFAPTTEAEGNLLQEGIAQEQIIVTGNTVVDALEQHINIANTQSTILLDLVIKPQSYIVITAHREENVDNRKKLAGIIQGLVKLTQDTSLHLIWPLHPRVKKQLIKYNYLDTLNNNDQIRLIEPLGYLDFIQLQRHAALVITDSGGLQEESCIMNVPCVTLRDNTERPETVGIGANRLVGTDREKIHTVAMEMIGKNGWDHPFGDGHAAQYILNHIVENLSHQSYQSRNKSIASKYKRLISGT